MRLLQIYYRASVRISTFSWQQTNLIFIVSMLEFIEGQQYYSRKMYFTSYSIFIWNDKRIKKGKLFIFWRWQIWSILAIDVAFFMQYFTIHHLRMIRYKLLEYLTKVNLFFIISRSIYFPLSNLQVMYLQKQKIKVNWLKVMELTKSKDSFFTLIFPFDPRKGFQTPL